MLTPPRVPLQILPRRPLDRRQICVQIRDAPSPTRSDRRVRPALVLLVIDVHLFYVFLVSLVFVFVMGADDGRSEPNDRAELHGCVVQESPFGLVLLIGRLSHVGTAVFESAD